MGRSPLNSLGSGECVFQNGQVTGSQGVGWAPSIFTHSTSSCPGVFGPPAANEFQLLRRAEHAGKPNTAALGITGPKGAHPWAPQVQLGSQNLHRTQIWETLYSEFQDYLN